MTHIEEIARAFAASLVEGLGQATVREINARNAIEDHPSVCHTHDFCDANVDMWNAFEHTLHREPDVDSESDADIWNQAWAFARAHNFFTEE